jgi:hypothetical protein
MNITRNNYELYFLDYYEGNLSAEQQAELFLFLEQHPGLSNEFESFEMVHLPSVAVSFEGKDSLKRGIITKENYQHYLIAKLEGDLTKEELHELDKFLFRHPEFKKDEKLFEYAKLTPEEIAFPDKSKLRQPVPVSERSRKAFYFSVAAAACLLVLIGVYFLRQNNNNESIQANNETKKEISPTAKNNQKSEGESVNPVIKKSQPGEKSPGENKSTFASTVNVEKKEKKILKKKNKVERNFAEKKLNPRTLETIDLLERKEIAHIETHEILQQQIASININLLKQELNNATALNSYLENVTDPDAKNNSESFTPGSIQNKQEQKPLLNLFAWALNIFSKKDVTLKKSYNAEGAMVAYQLESGKFKIGKSSSR